MIAKCVRVTSTLQNSSTSGSRRVPTLDGVRGLAALLVLGVHFQTLMSVPATPVLPAWIASSLSWGWSGVDLFFVLSGFLITGILLDQQEMDRRYRSFYARRSLRILPLYYGVLITCVCAGRIIKHFGPHSPFGPSPAGWICYFLYVQNWWLPIGRLYRTEYLGPLWSLAIEEQFYLIWPTFIWRLSRRTLMNVCVAGACVAFSIRLLLMLPGSSALTYAAYMNTFTRMDALLAGCWCALIARNQTLTERVRRLSPIVFASSAMGLCLLVYGGHDKWNDPGVMVFGHSFFAVGFACMVMLAYINDGSKTIVDRALSMAPLAAIGKYSYGVYVYQSFLLVAALHFLKHSSLAPSRAFALIVGSNWLLAVLAISFASYHLFEKRFLQMKGPAAQTGNG